MQPQNNPELKAIFIQEMQELLQEMQLGLQSNDSDPKVIDSVFRAAHSIKGMAGMFNLPKITSLAHALEHALNLWRSGKVLLHNQQKSLLIDAYNLLVKMFQSFVNDTPDNISTKELEDKLLNFATEQRADEDLVRDEHFDIAPYVKLDMEQIDSISQQLQHIYILQNNFFASMHQPSVKHELLSRKIQYSMLQLYHTWLQVRLLPARPLLEWLDTVVQKLAQVCNKKIKLTYAGEEMHIDRALLEALQAPMQHMLRNAIDHGIEADRKASGKNLCGNININISKINSDTIITIIDDGAGIDRAKLLAKARRLSLISLDAELNEQEIDHLIFVPGLSTKDAVSHISGRGIGMDVVANMVKNLGGKLEVCNNPGQGVKFTITLPSHTEIVNGVVITVSGDHYIIPITNIKAVVQKQTVTRGLVKYQQKNIPFIPSKWLTKKPTDVHQHQMLLVLESGERTAALAVDSISEPNLFFSKPLLDLVAPYVRNIAVLNDGKVAPICQVKELLGVV